VPRRYSRAMTTTEPPQEPRRRGFQTGRLEAFSDGVFAIAVTLLVLDIAVAGDAGKHLLRSVADLWPSCLAYVTSFSTIGAAWLAHNAITEYLDRADAAFVRLNLLLLLVVSFLPFPTRLFADYLGQDSCPLASSPEGGNDGYRPRLAGGGAVEGWRPVEDLGGYTHVDAVVVSADNALTGPAS
jgi:Endosomal/lysosomal potassium channel TMEM175